MKSWSFAIWTVVAVLAAASWTAPVGAASEGAEAARAGAETASTVVETPSVAAAGGIEARPGRRLLVPQNLEKQRLAGEKADPAFPFALGDLPSQGTLTISYEVEIDPAASWTGFPVTEICNQGTLVAANHGSVLTDDPDTMAAGDPTCTPLDAADLVITKSDAPDPVLAGQNLTYTVTVNNNGPRTAEGVTVTDTLPAGVTLVSTSGCAEDPVGVPTCTLGSIVAAGMAQYTITVTVDADVAGGTILTNQATASSLTPESNPGDESTSTTTTVGAEADLSIAKTDSADPVGPDDPLTYTVTVANAGPSDALGVVVTDTLPAGVTFVSTSGCAEDPTGVPTCTLGTVAAGGMASYTVQVTVDSDTVGTITNNASVTATTTDPNAGNDSTSEDTLVEPTADLSIDKIDSEDPVAGSSFTYTLEVTNNGPSEATGVEATDPLPAGLVFSSSADGCTEAGGVVTCPFGTLASGATASRSFVVDLDPPVPSMVSNTATVGGDQSDPDPSNDSDTEETTLDAVPPTVDNVNTLFGTGDGTLEECETAHRTWIQSLLVTFSEPIFDPPGDGDADDVTNPANYQLLTPGADRSFQTDACGGAVGDDQLVDLSAVSYDDGTDVAQVDLLEEAADDLYRFLVCGSTTIVDLAGNSLDGDGDGTGGDDFTRNFRVDALNRFANGHFDCDLGGWNPTSTNPAEIYRTGDDFEGSAESGSARIENMTASNQFQLDQCLELTPPRDLLFAGWVRLVAAGEPNALGVQRFCRFFDGTGCAGGQLGEVQRTLTGLTVGLWAPFGGGLADVLEPPAAALSARCGVRVDAAGGQSFTVDFDALFLGSDDVIFKDGFESGDTSAWSFTTP